MKNFSAILISTITLSLIFNLSINAQTLTLQPNANDGKDAFIRDLMPSQNFGNQSENTILAWTFNSDPMVTRVLIDFDLSSIPQGATVNTANLYLYNYPNAPSCNGQHSQLSGPNNMYIEKISTAWDEQTVSWSNQPATSLLNQQSIPPSTSSNQDYVIGVSAIVQDMIDNPLTSHGFMLRLQNESYYRSVVFGSSDNISPALRPKIIITYELDSIVGTINGTDVTCKDACDGTATASATGGQGGYTYLWDDPSSQNTATATGLCAGNYSVLITDANGTTETLTYTINEPTIMNVSISGSNASSFGACDGTAMANTTGGTPGYSYSWNDPSSQYGSSALGLCAGTYIVTVTDTNGCIQYASYTVIQPEDTLSNINDEFLANQIIVYPNPAINLLYVNNQSSMEKIHVSILNIQGQVVLNKSAVGLGSAPLNIANLSRGTYLVKIENGSHVIFKKFIKQ